MDEKRRNNAKKKLEIHGALITIKHASVYENDK